MVTQAVMFDTLKVEDYVEETLTVYGTRDYSRFQVNSLNRPINPKLLAKIVKSIQKTNRLKSYPIIVNSKMEVIDGQHRLQAAILLGLTIYYVINDDMKIQDAPRIGESRGDWPLEHYMKLWIAQKHHDYILLEEFWKNHSWLSLHTAASALMAGTHDIPIKETMADGAFLANNFAYAEKFAKMVLDFKPWAEKFYETKAFVAAVRSLSVNKHYNHARMMKKMKTHGHRLVKRSNTGEYYEVFNEIYNMRSPESDRVHLEPKRG